jgi:hypothetical protein
MCVGLVLADRMLTSGWQKVPSAVFSTLLLLTYVSLSLDVAKDRILIGYEHGGSGYASRAWSSSKTLRRMEDLPSSSLIFSNGPDAIYILTGMSSRLLPSKLDAHTRKMNDKFSEEMRHLLRQAENRDSFIVYFSRIGRAYLPSENELLALLPLQLIVREADGVIYKIGALQDQQSG